MSKRFFEDLVHAGLYAQYRPRPPIQLAKRIVQYLKEKCAGDLSLCLDVGCGNGQTSDLLAPYFNRILATDISPAQIQVAKSLNHPPGIEFVISSAEDCPAKSGSVQLINAATAAHFFDLPAFYKEAERVLCKNGVVALSCYYLPTLVHPTKSEQFRQALIDLRHSKQLLPYWASVNLQHVEKEYADIVLPFEDTVRDEIWADEETITLASLGISLFTWSAFQKMIKIEGEEAGQNLLQEFMEKCKMILETSKEPEEVQLKMKRKYFLLMGRKS